MQKFAHATKQLLEKRQREVKLGIRPNDRREWTVEELADMLDYEYLKNILRGDAARPPLHGVVMEMAACLECSSVERNQLLVAAGYAPVQVDLTPEELDVALGLAEYYISYLPVPAFVITRNWFIPRWNFHVLTLWDLTEDDANALAKSGSNHVLRLLFDPNLPVYHRMQRDDGAWDYTARLNIRRCPSVYVMR